MTSHAKVVCAIAAAGLVWAAWSPARAVSFNCAAAANCTEVTICTTPSLRRLDDRMAGLYYTLKSQTTRHGAMVLLNNQAAWLQNNYSCGCDAGCLGARYSERIRELREVLEAQ